MLKAVNKKTFLVIISKNCEMLQARNVCRLENTWYCGQTHHVKDVHYFLTFV